MVFLARLGAALRKTRKRLRGHGGFASAYDLPRARFRWPLKLRSGIVPLSRIVVAFCGPFFFRLGPLFMSRPCRKQEQKANLGGPILFQKWAQKLDRKSEQVEPEKLEWGSTFFMDLLCLPGLEHGAHTSTYEAPQESGLARRTK